MRPSRIPRLRRAGTAGGHASLAATATGAGSAAVKAAFAAHSSSNVHNSPHGHSHAHAHSHTPSYTHSLEQGPSRSQLLAHTHRSRHVQLLKIPEDSELARKIDKALHARFYLLATLGPNVFVVVGDDASLRFKVVIGAQRCSCRQKQCLHLLFVMLRLLKVRHNDARLAARRLQDYEVDSLMESFNAARLPQQRRRALAAAIGRSSLLEDDADKEDCPICLLHLHESEALTRCDHCGHQLHLHCMTVWAAARRSQHQELACPLCRETFCASTVQTLGQVAASAARAAHSPRLAHRRMGSDEHASAVAGDSDFSEETSDGCPPLPLASPAIELPRHCKAWAVSWGADVASALVSPDWTLRRLSLAHVAAKVSRQGSTAMSAEVFDSLCEIIEVAIADPVTQVLQAGLRLMARLPVLSCANHPRLVTVLQQVVLRCHSQSQRTRAMCLAVLSETVLRGLLTPEHVLTAICNRPLLFQPEAAMVAEGISPWKLYLSHLAALGYMLGHYSFWLHKPLSDGRTALAAVHQWLPLAAAVHHKNLKAEVKSMQERLQRVANEHSMHSSPVEAESATSDDNCGSAAPDCGAERSASRDSGLELEGRASALGLQDVEDWGEEAADPPALSMEASLRRSAAVEISSNFEEGRDWSRGAMLGAGSCGTVFAAIDNRSQNMMAVKEVTLTLKGCRVTQTRAVELQREIDILASLPPHRHVVQLYGHTVTPTSIRLFLEYVGQGTLRALVERFEGLPSPYVRRYTRHVTRALAFLHGHGIIHRDVKGCNILIAGDGTAKLSDFGAAGRLQQEDTMHNEFRSSHGTPAFMAPEMIRGENIGRKVDIWSLGCLVIEMVSGQQPWAELAAHNTYALMYHIASEAAALPLLPTALSELGRDFVLRCLQRDVAERPTAVCLLMHPFLD